MGRRPDLAQMDFAVRLQLGQLPHPRPARLPRLQHGTSYVHSMEEESSTVIWRSSFLHRGDRDYCGSEIWTPRGDLVETDITLGHEVISTRSLLLKLARSLGYPYLKSDHF